MEPDEYRRIAAAEDHHWWYRATRAVALDLLEPWLADSPRILDVGCGPGGFTRVLTGHGSVVGVDPSPVALELLRTREPHLPAIRSDATALPVPDGAFDVVTCIDVLYTVDDDRAAVVELGRTLRPGGAVLVVEPAFSALRRRHDRQVHGRRRYRSGELAALLADAGLDVRRRSYTNSFLVPPAAALAALDRIGTTPSEASDLDLRGSRLLGSLSHAERRWLRRHDLPIGTSAVLLASRALGRP